MTKNLSILQQNILAGFTPAAQKGFLRAFDKADTLDAEKFGNEVMLLTDFLDVALPCAGDGRVEREVLTDLERFILDRHFYWRFPQKGRAA